MKNSNVKSIFCAVIFALMWANIINAQDVITLRNGNEVKAKVTEISSSEIKYKRFDNLEGPTVVVAKSEVFAINYENGTREVINAMTAPVQSTVASAPEVRTRQPQEIRGPHQKNFYTGIYLDPLGFALVGPRLGAEFTFARRFIVEPYLRFPKLGLLTGPIWEGTFDVWDISGIGVGFGAKYFTGGRKGGFYVGPMFEYWTIDYMCYSNSHWKGTGIVAALNIGYKFQFSSGLYMRPGAMLGASKTTSSLWNGSESSLGSDVFYLLEFCVGIAF